MSKDEIREQSRLAGLPVWDEPASACLSSRVPYHHEVTPEKLRQIERGEEALHALGFRVCRVRHHDTRAQVEVAREDLPRALEPEMYDAIVRELTAAGYESVAIDPKGLSHRQPERRPDASSDLSITPKQLWTVRPRDAFSRRASRVSSVDARRHRLAELRARDPRLRSLAASATPARISDLHRACEDRAHRRPVRRARARCVGRVVWSVGALPAHAVVRRLRGACRARTCCRALDCGACDSACGDQPAVLVQRAASDERCSRPRIDAARTGRARLGIRTATAESRAYT